MVSPFSFVELHVQLCTCVSLEAIEKHLRRVLKEDGFPAYIIEQAARQRRTVTPLEEEDESKHNLCLPYVAGLGDDSRRIRKKYKIRTCFHTHSTLQRQLTKVKDMEPPNRTFGVVYSIPCSCGLEYIGEGLGDKNR